MFYLYVLWSDSLGRTYTGSTQDLEERLRRHNAGHCLATRPGIPWRLIHQEEFQTRSEAIVREKYYKTGRGREELRRLAGPPRRVEATWFSVVAAATGREFKSLRPD